MQYLWTNDIPPFPERKLSGDIHTEVCIIGGGMAGLLCAARLKECGLDTVVAEARLPGEGITKGTTAVLTAQHDLLYCQMIKKFGWDRAAEYLHANLDALQRFRQMAETIDCDLETRPSVMYSRTGQDHLKEEAQVLQKLGFPARYTTKPGLPFPTVDAVIYPEMAQFHPLRFLQGLAKNLNVYTHTFVRRLEGTTAYTDNGRIHARCVIVATHFPFVNRRGLYFMKQFQQRSYVIAYHNADFPSCTAVDAGPGLYFRTYRDLLLIGGGDHRTGQKGDGYAGIEDCVRRYFPQAKEAFRWANQDCVTLDSIPYIGPYSSAMPNVYVATGFNLWGMTTSMAAADILASQIQDKPHPYAAVFDPQRRILHPQLFRNLGMTLGSFLFPTLRRCPHLGCALHYNKAEHSWDCACHGSRFTEDGALIDNPAMKNAKI